MEFLVGVLRICWEFMGIVLWSCWEFLGIVFRNCWESVWESYFRITGNFWEWFLGTVGNFCGSFIEIIGNFWESLGNSENRYKEFWEFLGSNQWSFPVILLFKKTWIKKIQNATKISFLICVLTQNVKCHTSLLRLCGGTVVCSDNRFELQIWRSVAWGPVP